MTGKGFSTPPSVQTYGQPTHNRRPAWFWIAIAGGCCAVLFPILFIVAIILLPHSLRLNKPRNQATAIRTLRTIGAAEKVYSATYPDEGYACALNVLGGSRFRPPSVDAAQLISPSLAATGHRAGYIFSVTNCASKTANGHSVAIAYTIAAIPESVGRTGDRGYCIDQESVITVDPTGKWDCTEPLR